MFIKFKRNDYRLFILCALIFLLGVISCDERKSNKNNISLDPRYLQIESINSFANCNGPNGNYTTKVISKKDGALIFTQIFDYRDSPFMAKLSSDNKGFTLDENNKILDTLSNVSIEMIRSHDFHRLQTNPKSFFNQIKFKKRLDVTTELYSAIDRLNNPAKLYYDKAIKQLRSVEFKNMMDTTQVIKIVYKKWDESNYGKLAKEIEIIQAEKDTFNFSFETIKIN
ncbi:hypothetical protein [uncultured Aquimarina sp.]|uniref:hypothetical protein n=1 Tax=uncultured Aquimarina sp. TaxID=575652 RepID=UPI0026211310|nr:hypothetical protein [uncultured Aquimarina sp.]